MAVGAEWPELCELCDERKQGRWAWPAPWLAARPFLSWHLRLDPELAGHRHTQDFTLCTWCFSFPLSKPNRKGVGVPKSLHQPPSLSSFQASDLRVDHIL